MNKCNVSLYCGGCNYQGVTYEKQIEIKQKKVDSLLKEFGKVQPILPCKNITNYRNKMQVSFGYDDSHKVIYGNYVSSTHTIVPFDDCMINDEYANKIVQSIYKLMIKYHISAFDERNMKGCLRHVLVRCSKDNQYMVVLVTGNIRIKNEGFVRDIIKYNPNVVTIIQNINNKFTSMVLGDRNITLYGKGYIVDSLCGLEFQVSAASFYQVNKYQTEILYKQAVKLAKLNKDDVVIDAYCGTGTIGMIMSLNCKKVIGVEVNKQAVKDAIKNMRNNHIDNCEFICDDASKFMAALAKQKYHINTVIMDPPRAGADKRFLDSVISLSPKKIVYVSCNPITLKENLLYLRKFYNIDTIQPVDMFPFTEHVENIALLVRK